MSRDKVSEWSSTPGSNTDIGGININEGCPPSTINNAIREAMAQIKDLQAGTSGDTLPVASGGTGSTTASAARTALGLVIGTNVQAYDADLTTWAGKAIPTGVVVGTTDTQTLTNKTLTSNGTLQKFTSNANLAIALPAASTGKSYVVIVAYGGTHTLTWSGGGTLKWNGNEVPTATSESGKFDIFTFFSDGTNTYGATFGQGY